MEKLKQDITREYILSILYDTRPVSLENLLKGNQEMEELCGENFLEEVMEVKFPEKSVEELTSEERIYVNMVIGIQGLLLE